MLNSIRRRRDPFNLRFIHITDFQKFLSKIVNSGWSARPDQWAFAEGRTAGEVADDLADGPDHVSHAGLLLDHTVDFGPAAELVDLEPCGPRRWYSRWQQTDQKVGVAELSSRRIGELEVSGGQIKFSSVFQYVV